MSTETQQHRGDTEVADWRRTQLVRSGFSQRLASKVAGDHRYDVHALIGLVEHGCDPELAVRILSPLEAQGAT